MPIAGLTIERDIDRAASIRLLIGPVNRDGQASGWAQLLRGSHPYLDAVSLQLVVRPDEDPVADLVRPSDTPNNAALAAELREYLAANFTHVLIEAKRGIVSASAVADATWLRSIGIHAAIVVHASDLTPAPAKNKARRASQRKRVTALRRELLAFPGPVYVQSAELLTELPGSRYLPGPTTAAEVVAPEADVSPDDIVVNVLSEFASRPSRVLAAQASQPPVQPVAPRPELSADQRRPHVLYVAWGFPPCRGSGVYRALATANALYRRGFDVTVLTVRREVFERYTGADVSLEAMVADGINIERLTFDWPALEQEISLWPRARAKDPTGWLQELRKRDQADFPEVSYGPWKQRLLDAADRIADQKPVDLVIGTANPNVDLVVGPHLHQTRGVPYVMDYRDAWRLDVFSGDELQLDPRAAALEAAYVADAQEIWFVNDPIRSWHAQQYPQAAPRMFTVMNGYDLETAPRPRLTPPPPTTPLRFGYVGTITPKLPLREFLAGWREARAADQVIRRSSADLWGYLGFFALDDPSLRSVMAEGLADDVFFRGRVDKTQVEAVYDTFDVLLLILGSGRYVTSGKVFEYMAAAMPIVSVHDPASAAGSVLQGYPCWYPARDLSAAAIGEALIQASQAAVEPDPATREACARFALSFERNNQLGPRIEKLYAACQERL